jgi:cytochrome c551/c552
LTIDLPPETASFKPGPNLHVVNNNCLICHSADYVATQPPNLPRATWTASVTKMQKVFGAQISDADAAAIVDYLAKSYGNEPVEGKEAVPAKSAAPANHKGVAAADLATSSGCLGCHAVDHRIIGPAFKEVASKYKSDRSAARRLTAKVRQGGQGVWGTAPMPANTQVSEADAKILVQWVLSQK